MFKGKAGGAEMTPYKDLKAEELAAWKGFDQNSDKSRHTQYANAAAQQQPQQQDMGRIWDQIKTGGQKIGKAVGDFGSEWQSNYENSMREQGLMEPAAAVNPFPIPGTPSPENPTPVEETQNVEDLFKSEPPPSDGETSSTGGLSSMDLEKMGLKADENGNYFPSNNSKNSEMMYKLDPKTGTYVIAPNYGSAGGAQSQTPLGPITAAWDMGFGALDASGGEIK
jgi:hypothetical protein